MRSSSVWPLMTMAAGVSGAVATAVVSISSGIVVPVSFVLGVGFMTFGVMAIPVTIALYIAHRGEDGGRDGRR